MDMKEKQELLDFLQSKNKYARGLFMNPSDLVFEQNVKLNCFYCGRYENNWRCPPHLPDIDYCAMMTEFHEGLFVVVSYDIENKEDFTFYRNESSVVLHKLLLDLEKWMYNHNKSTALSFIGGSCKLCKGGCGKDKCNNPYMSRSPLEALGINVVKSCKKYDIDVTFPTDSQLKRVGLLVWQED